MYLILAGLLTVLFGSVLVLRAYVQKRRREERQQRSVKNRARQFGWEMVFGPRKLRLKHMPSDGDSE